MPDVGVLNLTIQDNSAKSAQGLQQLVDVLKAVKQAVSGGLGLSTVSNQLKKLTETISQNINQDVITKLNEFGDAMSKLNGLGNININIRGADRVSRAVESITSNHERITELGNAAESTTQQISEGFSLAERTIETVTESIREEREVIDEIKESTETIPKVTAFSSIEEAAKETGKTVEEVNKEIDENLSRLGIEKPQNIRIFSSIEEAAKRTGRSVYSITKEIGENLERIGVYAPGEAASRRMAEQQQARESAAQKYFSDATPQMQQEIASLINSEAPKVFHMVAEGAKEAQNPVEGASAAVKDAQKNTKNLTDTEEENKKTTNALSDAFRSLRKAIGNIGIVRLLGQFTRIARYRALRAVLRQITQGVSEGLSNFKKYSEAIGGTYYNNMQDLSAQLMTMKNSIGAAIAPAIQAAIPVIQTLTNAAIEAFNWVNQLFSLLAGKGSWTRATAVTADALDDVKNSAKGAGGAVKDMLADFDELNVLDHSGGGGGGGGSSTDLSQYENMFEEVYKFDQGIKDTIAWLEDHLYVVNGLVATLGSLLLGLPASVAIGIGLVVTGISWASDVGYNIGKNGLTTKSIAEAVGSVLTTALGGALIGYRIGGVPGAIAGAVIGIGVSLYVLFNGIDKGKIDSLYGDLHLTHEEIAAEVKKCFTVDVEAELENARFTADSIAQAKKDLTKQINDMMNTLGVFKLDPSKANAVDLALSVSETVRMANDLLKQYKTTVVVGFGFSTIFGDDSEFVQQFTMDKITGLEQYVTRLGNEIGNMIEQGITDSLDLEVLVKKLSNVTSAIESGKAGGRFTANITKGYGSVDWSHTDFETIKGYTQQYNEAADDLRESAYLNAMTTKEMLGGVYAGMAQQNIDEPGSYSPAEMLKAWWNYATYDVDKAANEFFDTASREGKRLYSGNVASSLGYAAGNLGNNLKFVNGSSLRSGNMSLLDWFQQNLANNLGWESAEEHKIFIDAMDIMEVTGWEYLGDSTKRMFIDQVESELGRNADTYRLLKEQLNIPVSDFFAISNWDYMTRDNAWKLYNMLVEAFGKDNVRKAVEDSGYAGEIYKALLGGFETDALKRGIKTAVNNWWSHNPAFDDLYGITGDTNETQDTEDEIGNIMAYGMGGSYVIDYDVGTVSNIGDAIKKTLEDEERAITDIVDNWDFDVPPVNDNNFKVSLEDIEYLASKTGVDTQFIMNYWHLLAPEVSNIPIQKSMEVIKTLALTTGYDAETIIANWDLISPYIDPNDTLTSVNTLKLMLNNNEMELKQIIGQDLPTGNVTTPNGFGADALASINALYNNMKKQVADPIMIRVGIQVEQAVVSAALSGIGNIGKLVLSKEQFHAAGAYDIPAGDLFVANEAGPELVGRMNGKTTVANQDQIIAGITQGVAEGQADQNALLREQNALLRQILAKDSSVRLGASAQLGKVARQSLDMYSAMAGV